MIVLTPAEKVSPLWIRLLEHCNERLREMRGRNDGPLDATATAALRGQISVYKALIALNDDLPIE